MNELRPIPGHPDYLCSASGEIWSTKRGVPRRMRSFVRDQSLHLGVNLTQDGKYRLYGVHRLIALTWIGTPPTVQHVVMHLDDDPSNNAASNLAYGLPAENSAQMVVRGRQARGERAGNSKLKQEQVAEIRRRLAAGCSQKMLAIEFGISATNVTDIKLNRIWREV